MSKNKTKYVYTIYNPENKLLTTEGDYNLLKELNIATVISNFSRRKSDDVMCKGYRVIRKILKI